MGEMEMQRQARPLVAHGQVVARARAYIEANLDEALSVESIAASAFASRRTLHRAFLEVLGETPQAYVLKRRLDRIRQDLASAAESERTVTLVAMHWGMPELGRMAARYRAHFGELPSQTLARRARAGPVIATERAGPGARRAPVTA